MTGADLIRLAGQLVATASLGTSAEARYRCAVSRAYYGAFHMAREYLDVRCRIHVLQNHRGHRQAYDELIGLGKPELRGAAQALDDLRSHRNRADYDLRAGGYGDPSLARQCVELADDVRIALERVLP